MKNVFDVVILGAGMSGLCMALQLKKHGLDSFLVLEKADRIGGTWRENTYPGVACDVPSHLYSFSFALNPKWTHMYSSGAEIQAYNEELVSEFHLEKHIRCNAVVTRASYEDEAWQIELQDGTRFKSQVVVSALGGLHIPSIPDFPGLSDYKGEFVHSAQWPSQLQLSNRRVAVIGTGASAIQIVPSIVDRVRHLTVFQRTPSWIVPRRDFAFSDKFKERFDRHRILMRLYRWFIYWTLEIRGRFVKKGSRLNRWLQEAAHKYISESIDDEELRRQLTPRYPLGCKRVLLSDDFYVAVTRPNVELVTSAIERFAENGVVTKDATLHNCDVVIAATGFEPFAVNRSVNIIGRGHRTLNDDWRDRIEAHKTVMVPGFPNLFFLLGPNSGLGHNSVLLMIEAQTKFIIRSLQALSQGGMWSMEPRVEAKDAYNLQLSSDLEDTVYGGGCGAWYTDANNHNFTLWPHSTIRYFLTMRNIHKNEFLWTKHSVGFANR